MGCGGTGRNVGGGERLGEMERKSIGKLCMDNIRGKKRREKWEGKRRYMDGSKKGVGK